jgi:lipid A disaccharide synthetase
MGGLLQGLGLKRLFVALSLKFSKHPKALPNVISGQVIVPEIVAKLTPAQLADQIWTHWQNPAALANMRGALVNILGKPGVAKRIVAALPSYLGVSWN